MTQLNAHQPSKTFRGTWDEILAHSDEIPKTSKVELRVFEPKSAPKTTKKPAQPRVSAMGKYAFVPGGSEDFAREKQAEIEREDRSRG